MGSPTYLVSRIALEHEGRSANYSAWALLPLKLLICSKQTVRQFTTYNTFNTVPGPKTHIIGILMRSFNKTPCHKWLQFGNKASRVNLQANDYQ